MAYELSGFFVSEVVKRAMEANMSDWQLSIIHAPAERIDIFGWQCDCKAVVVNDARNIALDIESVMPDSVLR